jgi:hypothetical protein
MKSNLSRRTMCVLLLMISSVVFGIESTTSSTSTGSERTWTDAEVSAMVREIMAACDTAIDESVLAALNEANERIRQAQDEKKAAQDLFAVGCFVSGIVAIIGTSLVWHYFLK